MRIDLPTCLYYQAVHTLTKLLPPPLDDSAEASHVRNRAAIAKVAALLPVNADEVELAAQCIAARAQAEDILRLIRQHRGDIALTMRLNAQYGSMVRASLSVHGRLKKIQATRQKREAIDGTADQDALTQHIAEQSALAALDPATTTFKPAWPAEAHATPPEPARSTPPEQAPSTSPEQTRPTSPQQAPIETQPAMPIGPSADVLKQKIDKIISEIGTNSQDTAFETWLSGQSWDQGSGGPEEIILRILREAMAQGFKTDPEITANVP